MFRKYFLSKIFTSAALLLLATALTVGFASAEDAEALPQVGEAVRFGRYEQNNDLSDGPEELTWRVLDRNEDAGTLLLITAKGIEHVKYNETAVNEDRTRVYWQRSSLRAWLNDDFYTGAFTAEEQACIETTTVNGTGNIYGGVLPGAPTEDKVFTLSRDECSAYFNSEGDYLCPATEAAYRHGASVTGGDHICWWWVRDPGEPKEYAMHVSFDGTVHVYGKRINCSGGTVRPVMWVRWE